MSKYKYLIENIDASSRGSLIVTLKPKKTSDIFNFQPGQYAMLSFFDSAGKLFINHPFSIASSPTQNGRLRFGIKVMGKFTQNLNKLQPGEEVEILGPFGNFVFNENKYQEVVFLAGGVGITPFISAVQYATDKGLYNKIDLLYSNRTIKDALFYEDIKRLAQVNPNFKPKLKITQESVNGENSYCENGYITKETITENVGQVAEKDFFICGPSQFMKAMETNLVELGVSNKKIHQEAFNVTPNLSFKENYKNIFLVYGLSMALFIFFLSSVYANKLNKLPTDTSSINQTPITLINNVVNDRRNSIINSKQLLSNTINTASAKKAVGTNATRIPTPVVKKQQTIIAPVVSQPAAITPAYVPVAPRTRVS